MSHQFRKIIKVVFVVGFSFQHSLMARGDIETAGDIIQLAIPAIGYGTTWYLDDEEGRNDFYKSLVTNTTLTHVIKAIVDRERPNGGRHSFLSGHTSSAFQGAAFIHKRYGWEYAIAPYIGATFVGYSRVHANKHYVSDVVAGAALGLASSWFLTTEYEGYTVTPKVDVGMIGVSISKKW
jgi:membrane-associated phospholipid phosphatase